MNLLPNWRKSSHTGEFDCVELADLTTSVGIRDSKDPMGPRLTLSQTELVALVRQIKASELDL